MTNAGQFAAVIMSASAQGDEARAIQALIAAGHSAREIMAHLDEAMRLAVEWSRPVERRAA